MFNNDALKSALTDKKERKSINSTIFFNMVRCISRNLSRNLDSSEEKHFNGRKNLIQSFSEYENHYYNWVRGTTLPIYPLILYLNHFGISADYVFETTFNETQNSFVKSLEEKVTQLTTESSVVSNYVINILDNDSLNDADKLVLIRNFILSNKSNTG